MPELILRATLLTALCYLPFSKVGILSAVAFGILEVEVQTNDKKKLLE
jgi:hypothetical protein